MQAQNPPETGQSKSLIIFLGISKGKLVVFCRKLIFERETFFLHIYVYWKNEAKKNLHIFFSKF